MTPTYRAAWHTDEIEALAALTTKFVTTELAPRRVEFERQQHIDRDLWNRAGDLGLLCCAVPEQYGGAGGTFAHDLAVTEAQTRLPDVSWGNMVHSGIVSHYVLAFGTEEQKQRWLPGMVSGELVGAIAMTEPGAGSDLQGITTRAVRDGSDYLISGSKTFISNGILADLIIVVTKTDPGAGHRGISLIVVETANAPGFHRGRNLDKVGGHAADTAELFFDEVRVSAANLLGGVAGHGFLQLMQQLPQERLLIGLQSAGIMELAVEETLAYTKTRTAFGRPLFDNQNTRFVLAESATRAQTGRVFVDSCIDRHLAGSLDSTTAAMCKWWLTELACNVVDECLQMFGGGGWMTEYPIARLYGEVRVLKIVGGTNEIMKQIISNQL